MEPIGTQIAHDEMVRRQALNLLLDGYQVQARLDDWSDRPDFIYGYRPDIIANRGGEFIIIEVVKGDMDWPKIVALQRYEHDHREFELRMVGL